MNKLNEILLEELPDLKKHGEAFLNKELSKLNFKRYSGAFGVYAMRSQKSFILRFRLPGGVISKEELQFIYDMALKYNLGGIHLTTRQCIQLHNLSLDAILDIIEQGILKGLYTRGSGGNYPRNVSMSPLTGVTPGEAFDVLPFAIAANVYLLKSIYAYHLPRKFKVAFSNTPTADAHSTIQDLGFIAMSYDHNPFFKVYAGGGLGKDPEPSLVIPISLPPSDVLYAIEAMLNLFIKEGNYEDHNKARVRYIVNKLGKAQFITRFLDELEIAKQSKELSLPFTPNFEVYEDWSTTLIHPRIFKQKQINLYSMYFQPLGGQLTLKLLKQLLQYLDSLPKVRLRLTMTEGFYMINLDEATALKLLELTDGLGGETKLAQSVSCIGVPTCQMGILNSQELLDNIISYFNYKKYKKDILPRLYISGCPNSCGVHQIGSIGFAGKKKRIENVITDCYTLYIGGSFHADHVRLGRPLGDIPSPIIPEFLYKLAQQLESLNINFDTWFETDQDSLTAFIQPYLV